MKKICLESEASLDYYALFKARCAPMPSSCCALIPHKLDDCAVASLVCIRQVGRVFKHFPCPYEVCLQAIMRRAPNPMSPLESLASSAVRTAHKVRTVIAKTGCLAKNQLICCLDGLLHTLLALSPLPLAGLDPCSDQCAQTTPAEPQSRCHC